MTFDYGYNSYMPSTEAVGSAGVLLLLLVIWLFTFGLSILMYVFQSVGLQTIAKRRGIRKSWLAWIPLGNMWIIGSIADQYQYVAKGNVRNRRKVLLGLTIATWVVMLPFYFIYFRLIAGVITGFFAESDVIASVLLILALALAMLVLAVILTVFQYIALYDVFCSCSPDSAVLMLVLSIFFNVTLPFFLFAVRKKDGGMPPRKPPVEPVYQPLPQQSAEFTEE